jgi:hypothetical protein
MWTAVKNKRKSSGTRGRLRTGSPLIAAAGIAATGLAALTATVPAQAAATSAAASPAEWHTAYSTHGGPSQKFSFITAPAKNDAWAVATTGAVNTLETPTFTHWNGKAWSRVTIKAAAGFDYGNIYAQGFFSAYSSAPDNVWIFGNSGPADAPVALVFNGKKWQVEPLPADFGYPLAVVGPKDVWAESTETCAAYTAGCTVLLHWNGTTWTRDKIAGIQPEAASAGAHAWILTINDGTPVPRQAPSGHPIIRRTTGARLVNVVPPRAAKVFQDQDLIVAAPDGRAWFTGGALGNELYSWTGRKWVNSAIPETVCSPGVPKPCVLYVDAANLSYDGKNGFWDGPWAHWTGRNWINTSNVAKPLINAFFGDTAAIPGTNSAWSVGQVSRTSNAFGTPTNGIIGVYGTLP